MRILSIDPGNVESAFCLIDSEDYIPLEFGKTANENLRVGMYNVQYDKAIIEMVASYGMAVGATVFETCVAIGQFKEIAMRKNIPVEFIYRKDEKMNLCHSMKAKDSNIRQALIDRFGPVGTKKNPRLVLWLQKRHLGSLCCWYYIS
jgi:hypothetical protein